MEVKTISILALALSIIAIILVMTVLVGSSAEGAVPLGVGGGAKPQCSDLIDNDGDSYTDYPSDPGCTSKRDTSELNANIECDDGKDNDLDGAIDMRDGGCSGPTDNDETNCGDGKCEGGETCSSCQSDCGMCNTCSDTDGGWVPKVQGTVSGYYSGQPYSYTDYCIDSAMLNEYYCSGGLKYSSSFNCAGNTTISCSNGACV
jgi:hypothetical protein